MSSVLLVVAHKVDSILIEEVHNMSLHASVDVWVEAVTGFSKETLEKWAAVLGEKKFFKESEIQKALHTFCSAKRVTARYVPLSSIFNYTLEFVGIHKGDFPDLPGSLVIENLANFRNAPHYLTGSYEQGGLAVKCKSDVVEARENEQDNCAGGKQPHFPKLAIRYKLKYTGPITSLLEKREENDMLLLKRQNGEDKEDKEDKEDERRAEEEGAAEEAQDPQSEVRPSLYILFAALTLLFTISLPSPAQ